jgi:hypothetical protein
MAGAAAAAAAAQRGEKLGRRSESSPRGGLQGRTWASLEFGPTNYLLSSPTYIYEHYLFLQELAQLFLQEFILHHEIFFF